MTGAPSHVDDWRCPLYCHSMTAPRLLKIDRGELGQKKKKKHVNSDQKTQLGHVDAHENDCVQIIAAVRKQE